MHEFDDPLSVLLKNAKTRGFLSFQAVHSYLPDEGGSPSLVDVLVLNLEDTGLDLKEDPQGPLPGIPQKQINAEREREENPQPTVSSRDPVRMYLSQMGNIPLLTREREIYLAKKIEVSRKRYRRALMECHFAMGGPKAILPPRLFLNLPFREGEVPSEPTPCPHPALGQARWHPSGPSPPRGRRWPQAG